MGNDAYTLYKKYSSHIFRDPRFRYFWTPGFIWETRGIDIFWCPRYIFQYPGSAFFSIFGFRGPNNGLRFLHFSGSGFFYFSGSGFSIFRAPGFLFFGLRISYFSGSAFFNFSLCTNTTGIYEILSLQYQGIQFLKGPIAWGKWQGGMRNPPGLTDPGAGVPAAPPGSDYTVRKVTMYLIRLDREPRDICSIPLGPGSTVRSVILSIPGTRLVR